MSTNQNATVLAYLRSGRPLDVRIAAKRWGCYRLAARIRDLRDAGYNISTQLLHRGSIHWAVYRYVGGTR